MALSPPSDGLLGRWELRTVTKHGTKRFHESVWNDSDIYIYITDVTWFTAINFMNRSFDQTLAILMSCHTASAYSTCGGLVSGFLGRSLARLYELKFVAEEVPEVVGLKKSSELPTWHSFQLRDLPQATQRRRPPRIWPPSQEQPSVGGLRTETSIIAGAISAHIYLTRHIASKWVGSCYCWSPIQTKAWKPTISLVLLQLSRQEKLWSLCFGGLFLCVYLHSPMFWLPKIYTIVRITPCYCKAGFPCKGPHWRLSTHGK